MPRPHHARDEALSHRADAPELQPPTVRCVVSTQVDQIASHRIASCWVMFRSLKRGMAPGPIRMASAICSGDGAERDRAICPPPIESPMAPAPMAGGARVQVDREAVAQEEPAAGFTEGIGEAARHDGLDVVHDRSDLRGGELRLAAALVRGVGQGRVGPAQHEVDGGRPAPCRPGPFTVPSACSP